MRHTLWKQLMAMIVCALLLVGSIGISAVADGEPELWVGGVKVTEANASDILGNGNVSFDFDTNTLTFAVQKPTLSGLHNGALIDSDMETLTIVTAAKGLTINNNSATKGINMSAGALTVNGKLSITLGNSSAEAGVYAEKGLTVNGSMDVDLYEIENACGVISPDGPVTVTGNFEAYAESGISCAGGDVTVGGYFSILSNSWADNSYGIYVTNGYGVNVGDLYQDIGSVHGVVYAEGDVLVRGAVSIQNTMPIGGEGIRSVNGKVECQSTVTIAGDDSKVDVFIYAGGEEGIVLGGNTTFAGRAVAITTAFTAPNGPITVNGNLTMTAGGKTMILAKDDITINGNATLKNNLSETTVNPYNGKAMSSTAGSINVTGNLKSNSSDSGVYAYNDVNVGGDLTTGVGLLAVRDYIVKAENGALTVGRKLTTTGVAQNVAYGKTGVTVGEVAVNEVFRDGMDPTGCYVLNAPDGSVTVEGTVNITTDPAYGYEGTIAGAEFGVAAGDKINIAAKWDVTASSVALQAANGIVKPANFGVTAPEGGRIVQLADGATVTEADGTTVAAHAVIDEVEAITITLDPCNDGESEAITMEIPVGGTIDEFPTVTYTGHKFIGWFTEAAANAFAAGIGEEITTETVFSEDTTIFAHWYMPGDINGDGQVNNKDLTRLQRYLGGENVQVVTAAVDVNGDGKINNKDLTRLQRYISFKDVEIF